MSTLKKLLVIVMSIMMFVTVMVVPASALENGWPERIANFQEVAEYNDDIYPGYVKAAQRFFLCYSGTKSYMGSSTVDGDFGPATFSALRRFRALKGLSDNDLMDSDAWRALAKELDSEARYSNPNRAILIENGGNIMLVLLGTHGYSYYYYTAQDAYDDDDAFHFA